MYKLKNIFIIFFVAFNISYSDNIKLDIETSLFYKDDFTSIWEMYYSFPENILIYKHENEKLIGEMYFAIKIYSNIQTVVEHEWVVQHIKEDNSFSIDRILIGQKSFELKKGQYNIELFIADVNKLSEGKEVNFEILVNNCSKNQICLSNIELAGLITSVKTSSIPWDRAFQKDTLFVVPHPSLIYNAKTQSLYSYIEIYNSKSNIENSLIIKYSILNVYKKIVKKNEKLLKPDSDKFYDINEIDISDLSGGAYYLQVSLVEDNEDMQEFASTTKKFFVLNTDKSPRLSTQFTENLSFETSEFFTLTPEQTKKEIEKIKIIATPQEVERMDLLTTTDAMKRMLFRFWLKNDTDKSTPINEAYYEFMEKVKFANRNFSYGLMKDGWKTDRGRVLVKYGHPTQIDKFPFEGEQKAYETWFFGEVQGGVNFHFVDVTGFGNYILAHSDAYMEYHNENWFQDYVQRGLNNRNDDNFNIQNIDR